MHIIQEYQFKKCIQKTYMYIKIIFHSNVDFYLKSMRHYTFYYHVIIDSHFYEKPQ